jgi:hypothetical protein
MLEYMQRNGIAFANIAYGNEAYARSYFEGLELESSNYGVELESFIIASDYSNLAEVGTAIEDSEVNVWIIIVADVNDGEILDQIVSSVSRPIHYIFADRSDRLFEALSADSAAKIMGSANFRPQGLRPGLMKAEAFITTMAEVGLSQAEWESQEALADYAQVLEFLFKY